MGTNAENDENSEKKKNKRSHKHHRHHEKRDKHHHHRKKHKYKDDKKVIKEISAAEKAMKLAEEAIFGAISDDFDADDTTNRISDESSDLDLDLDFANLAKVLESNISISTQNTDNNLMDEKQLIRHKKKKKKKHHSSDRNKVSKSNITSTTTSKIEENFEDKENVKSGQQMDVSIKKEDEAEISEDVNEKAIKSLETELSDVKKAESGDNDEVSDNDKTIVKEIIVVKPEVPTTAQSRITISNEETMNAVAALLGTDFGSDLQSVYNTNGDETPPAVQIADDVVLVPTLEIKDEDEDVEEQLVIVESSLLKDDDDLKPDESVESKLISESEFEPLVIDEEPAKDVDLINEDPEIEKVVNDTKHISELTVLSESTSSAVSENIAEISKIEETFETVSVVSPLTLTVSPKPPLTPPPLIVLQRHLSQKEPPIQKPQSPQQPIAYHSPQSLSEPKVATPYEPTAFSHPMPQVIKPPPPPTPLPSTFSISPQLQPLFLDIKSTAPLLSLPQHPIGQDLTLQRKSNTELAANEHIPNQQSLLQSIYLPNSGLIIPPPPTPSVVNEKKLFEQFIGPKPVDLHSPYQPQFPLQPIQSPQPLPLIKQVVHQPLSLSQLSAPQHWSSVVQKSVPIVQQSPPSPPQSISPEKLLSLSKSDVSVSLSPKLADLQQKPSPPPPPQLQPHSNSANELQTKSAFSQETIMKLAPLPESLVILAPSTEPIIKTPNIQQPLLIPPAEVVIYFLMKFFLKLTPFVRKIER